MTAIFQYSAKIAPPIKDRVLSVLTAMYLARYSDYKMEKLVKQNKGTTFFMSVLGHEIIGSVAGRSLEAKKDWFFPYYRDRSLVISLGADLTEIFASFLARETSHHSGGRMMPEHFSHKELRITCQSSCVGSQYLQAVGLAKGLALSQKNEVVYVSGGDGSTSQGDFHEALNFAAIHKLGVIFVVEDNGWAISVPQKEQTAGNIADIAKAYKGFSVFDVEGHNFLHLFAAFDEAVNKGRRREGPSLIRVEVPRLCPHSNSDDPKKYKSAELIAEEQKRDPLPLFEKWLQENDYIDESGINELKRLAQKEVENASLAAEKLPFPQKESATTKVFVNFEVPQKGKSPVHTEEKITLLEGINQAIAEEMELNPHVVIFGEDVAREKGGAFGVTRDLTKKFGEKRCFNTPLAESTIVGLAIGMAFDEKHRPIAEIQFADYMWTGINQLVNELGSIFYRSNGEWQMPVVVRMPYGGYIQGGPYHSQSVEAVLTHTPGLKVVVPSNARDAKALLKSAIIDPNPVIFLEHKALYRAEIAKSYVPKENVYLPFGKANVVQEGSDVSIICWGMMVHLAHSTADRLAKENISCEIIDLRTLVPLDMQTVLTSLKKTGKVIILHEAPKTCGFGAELAARISEEGFFSLDAPILRVCGKDCPIPYCQTLEAEVLPQSKDLEEAIFKLISF